MLRRIIRPFNRIQAGPRIRKNRPFNRIELILQRIPTWLFISSIVLGLGAIALWINPSGRAESFKNVVQVIFENAESIAIAAAVALYFKEIPDRKQAKHYEAWQVIDNANGIQTSYARRKAIENLHEDRVSFFEIDLPGADLQEINLRGADLRLADLRGANLRGANLRGANLRGANLSKTNLVKADLSSAHLTKADLSGADLSGAHLTKADLRGADLSSADLISADLRGADLSYAHLISADLRGADLSYAHLIGTDLMNANLDGIQWNESTKWPGRIEVAKAENIPEALRQQLGI